LINSAEMIFIDGSRVTGRPAGEAPRPSEFRNRSAGPDSYVSRHA
jgi:hypothetical protein